MKYLDFARTASTRDASPILLERLVLAIDVSPSMEDRDWPPSRLAAAQEAAAALIRRKLAIAPADQVGIVAYGRLATVAARPMRVAEWHDSLLNSLRRLTIANGTSIAAGLAAAGQLLLGHGLATWLRRWADHHDNDQAVQPRIVLLTDGHHNSSGDVRQVAADLKARGVTIDCVGIGGGPSDVDESLLRAVASPNLHDGSPRYAFIGDKGSLIERFEHLAGRITR